MRTARASAEASGTFVTRDNLFRRHPTLGLYGARKQAQPTTIPALNRPSRSSDDPLPYEVNVYRMSPNQDRILDQMEQVRRICLQVTFIGRRALFSSIIFTEVLCLASKFIASRHDPSCSPFPRNHGMLTQIFGPQTSASSSWHPPTLR